MVILEVEHCAKEMGENTVTEAVVDKASRVFWERGFHSESHSPNQ